jgi:hypothetical protein
MKRNHEKDSQTVQVAKDFTERAFDLWGELQLEKETEDVLQQIETEQTAGGNPEMELFFSKNDTKYLSLIQNQASRHNRRHFICVRLPRIARAAAMLIAIMTVMGGAALAASPYLRVQVMRLMTRVTPQYTELRLVENEAATFDVPADWKGTHYPAYVPQGMEIVQITNSGESHIVVYRGITDRSAVVNFLEGGPGGVTHVDTEDAVVLETDVKGQAATLVRKGNSIQVYWTDGAHMYMVSAKGVGEETVLRMARSVQPVK